MLHRVWQVPEITILSGAYQTYVGALQARKQKQSSNSFFDFIKVRYLLFSHAERATHGQYSGRGTPRHG